MSSSSDDFVADINVTPLVDVMLVLLIIFMVTAPAMTTEGLDVDLPKVEVSETLPTENDHAMLTIRDNGAVFIDEYETTLDDLERVLQVQIKQSRRQLFVRADQHVPYGIFMRIMGKIRKMDIKNVGLVTVPAEKTENRKTPAKQGR